MANHHSEALNLDRTSFPGYPLFAETCYRGLSAVQSFKDDVVNDPGGWKFGKTFPPSYASFGRMRALLAVQEALLLKPHRALEIAAGGGGLSVRLAASGCDVVVNDLREEVIRSSLNEFSNSEGVRIEAGNVFDLSPDNLGKFDLVIACEIIEHVAHPDDLLRHLKTFLKPKGRLLLTTPNGSYFRNKLPTLREVQDFDELEIRQFQPDADGHLFLLTPRELSELATTVGLRVERLAVWGTPVLSGHIGLRYLAGRPFGKASYLTEVLAQHLPRTCRTRVCVALSATLRLEEDE